MTPLSLPELLYGTHAEVKGRLRRVVTALGKGTPWPEALGASDSIDVSKREGLIVMDGPAPLIKDAAHFQAYLPWVVVDDAVGNGRLEESVDEQMFEASVREPWGVLGLMAHRNQMWVFAPTRHRAFLRAAAKTWAQLDGAGARYSAGATHGATLWSLPNTLRFILANHGVDERTLSAKLSSAQVHQLIAGVLARNDF